MMTTAAHTPRPGADSDPRGDAGQPDDDIYDDGHLRVEHRHYYVTCGGERLALSRKEFLIISRIARGAGQWVNKEDIWASVWGEDATFDDNNLRVSVHYARRKLRRHGVEIENDPPKGYRLTARAHDSRPDGGAPGG